METLIVICIAIFVGMILAFIFGGVMGLFASIGIFAISTVVYFLPTIVAIHKKNPSALWIFLINLFFGMTVIAWVIALIWAFNGHKIIAEFLEYRKNKVDKTDDVIEGEYTKAE